MAGYVPAQGYTADDFAKSVMNNNLPWVVSDSPWNDTLKERYFNILDTDKANQHELEMWRLNNEYNTPAKQMERMIEAGINPAAAYGQVSSGVSGSAPGTHMTSPTRVHEFADKMQINQFAVDTLNQFVKSLGDTANMLISMPEQLARNRTASFQAELASRELEGYDMFRNELLHDSMPEWERTVSAGYSGNYEDLGDGWHVKRYRLHDPVSLKYIRDFLDVSQRQETRNWYKDYRKHLNTMFADEEDILSYEKEMRKWLNDYKKTLPPQARYVVDLLQGLFTTFGAPFIARRGKSKKR